MRIVPLLRFTAVVPTVALSGLLLAAESSSSELIFDHFDYGAESSAVFGLNGGEGWNGAWAGFNTNGLNYDPTANIQLATPGYRDDDPAGGGVCCPMAGPNSRDFATNLVDDAWLSATTLTSFQPGDLLSMGSNTALPIRFGLQNGGGIVVPFIDFAGDGLSSGGLNVGVGEHLLIARLQVNYDASGHDRVSIWVDPPNLEGGVVGLGAPAVVRDGFDALSGWNGLTVGVANNNTIGSIRIAHGGVSADDRLASVLLGRPPCDDGIDNDLDGLVDFDPALGDPGCGSSSWPTEDPECQDGQDNDGQLGTDFDGGASQGISDPDGPDPQCVQAYLLREERSACGLGVECSLLLPALLRLRRGMRA